MDAIQMIKERRSVRSFKDEKVPHQTMKEIVELSRWSPSWANFQVARYTITDDDALIARIAKEGVKNFAYNVKTLENAKGIAVISYVKGKSGRLTDYGGSDDGGVNTWEVFDAGIACQTFCLAAHALGVGTCIFGVIDDEAIGKILEIPEGESVAALVVYGFEQGEHAAPTPRKNTEDILRFK